ncbi:MAG TPA: hypothetical protein O0X23_00080 [Methanocorpusculum sp.]|nr:hypothetical protein [Methanocorpusculum sp.]
MRKVDKCWNKLFERHNILEAVNKAGQYVISADQIREVAEPRLVTKFDHTENLPDIFVKNHLSILPITRGEYLISHIKTHHSFESFEESESADTFRFPEYIQSIDPSTISSESIALNCAFISGILKDFVDDDQMMPTVQGRMSSGRFSFEIATYSNGAVAVEVSNAQVEIDGAYEGIKYLTLVEAKCEISKDFIVRQIYYPYRLWKSKVPKDIKIVYLIYSNSIFNLYQYKFDNPDCYNSLRLEKQNRYSIEDTNITIDDIQNVLNSVQTGLETKTVPFPQADNFKRIINLCELLMEKDMNKDDITEQYAFTPRQTDYYTNAGIYLGLIKKERTNGVTFRLTENGEQILKLPYKQRQLEFVKCIITHNVFLETLRLFLNTHEVPRTNDIIKIMKNNVRLGSETYTRRSSTVGSWVNWIVSLIWSSV